MNCTNNCFSSIHCNIFIPNILHPMKKVLLLLSVFITLLVSSCNKNKRNSELSIAGLTDITLNENYTSLPKTIPISINQKGVSSENINLSLEGMPDGVELSLSVKSGVPNFSSSINARINKNLDNGSYPIKMIAKNDAGDETVFPFNIIVELPCYEKIIGNYTLTETIDGVEKTYITQLAQTSSDKNMVMDYKYYNPLRLDCNNKTIKMDNSYIAYDGSNIGYIYGTGTFTDKTLTMDCVFVPNNGGAYKTVKRVFTRR